MRLPIPVASSYLGLLNGQSDESVLGGLAGLAVLHENSRFLFRLECGARLVTRRLPSQVGPQELSRNGLLTWLVQSPFAPFDDPLNDVFTDEFPFFGGSYLVFPGPVEGALFVLRRLARGLFLRSGVAPDGALWRRCADLLVAALRISDTVARRAGIERGVEPIVGDQPCVPPEPRLRELEATVSFSTAELGELLRDVGGADVLGQITQVPDRSGVRDEDYGDGSFVSRPLIALDEDCVIAFVHALIPAAMHAIVSTLIEAGYREAFRRCGREPRSGQLGLCPSGA